MIDLNEVDEQVQKLIIRVKNDTIESLKEPIKVNEKTGRKDLVTTVDKHNEQMLVDALRKIMPDSQILGEEGFGDEVKDLNGWTWIIDPIDGTMNFVMQKNNFAIMIALYHDGEGVLGYIFDVMNNDLYHGGPAVGVFRNQHKLKSPENISLKNSLIGISGPLLIENKYKLQNVARVSRGPRMYGSAGIEFIAAMNGELCGYVSYLRPWDFGAGKILAETLGLVVKSIDGTQLNMLSSSVVLVATQRASQEVIELAN